RKTRFLIRFRGAASNRRAPGETFRGVARPSSDSRYTRREPIRSPPGAPLPSRGDRTARTAFPRPGDPDARVGSDHFRPKPPRRAEHSQARGHFPARDRREDRRAPLSTNAEQGNGPSARESSRREEAGRRRDRAAAVIRPAPLSNGNRDPAGTPSPEPLPRDRDAWRRERVRPPASAHFLPTGAPRPLESRAAAGPAR